ncbi:family 20 glycosylhydrolase [Galbibacter pacificus]|uniref:beta-N-acetylhexosaminidase n=1 Tax=Galbibacter pacificus TaxID=2996052 RepID=A0ABT6FUX9_9FLAO|nr:family 20 glycosylhydrolase [Galbibacter pacificus]MDG3583454.1 family 20 glycosylhydrolase [Galbibacter pacificus]MDG3587069.1 family 20 glycosylhydrolase [Galbibacter pacificus]
MKLHSLLLLLIVCMSCNNPEKNTLENTHAFVTPKPQELTVQNGSFTIDNNTAIVYTDDETKRIANFFADKIKAYTGIKPKTSNKTVKKNTIVLKPSTTFENDEAYTLNISNNQILMEGSHRGLFYAMESLLQLIPVAPKTASNNITAVTIPALSIKDKPAFSWRGIHLDVSRHFFTVEEIKKQLDVLSLFKINKFHWHLTDDQGWRVEIKKYPKLVVNGIKDNPERKGEEYYTQEDIKEVVAYAKERYIDVVPEIETPGHAVAALAAYPEYACNDTWTYQPRELWGIDYNIFCAGKESVFTFLEDVFEELVPLFPYKYYHVGGDEVPKKRWEKCPLCQKRIKDEGLANEEELQSYFIARVEQILKKHDKEMIGWDEILEGGITPTTNIMSWQGEEGGIKAANAGHDVIMSPTSHAYLNFHQGDYRVEPMAHGGYIPLEKIYNYDPVPEAINEDKRHHILGMQGNHWTEYAYEGKDIEYYAYPRIIALAELTWTGKEKKDYTDFLTRLDELYPVLDHYNINYHIPLPEGPTANGIVFTDSVTLAFHTTHPVKMVYTIDGTSPTAQSPAYKKPITFTENTEINIATVLPTGKISTVRTLHVKKGNLKNAIAEKELAPGLTMTTLKGHFTDASAIKGTFSNPTTIKHIKDANVTYDWGKEIDTTKFRAVSIKGYVDIPEDGVYYFASKQEKVKIADSLIIDPEYTLKRFPLEGTIALKKGLHPIEILYLNNVIKGWASDWNEVEVKYRKANEIEYKTIDSTMIYHMPIK